MYELKPKWYLDKYLKKCKLVYKLHYEGAFFIYMNFFCDDTGNLLVPFFCQLTALF